MATAKKPLGQRSTKGESYSGIRRHPLRTLASIPDEEWRTWQAVAEAKGESASDMIRRVVRAYVKKAGERNG